MNGETSAGRGSDHDFDIKPQHWAAEHHQRRKALRGKDRLCSTNTRYSTSGTSASRVAGMCRSVTRAPRDPPVAIAPTTRTRQGTPAGGILTSLQVVTTNGT